MSKDKIDNILASLEANYNVKKASDLKPEAKMRTGVFALDSILSGGLTDCLGGHRLEFFGNESSGKTTFALHVIKRFQEMNKTCVFIDGENSYSTDWAEIVGVDNKKLIVIQPNSLEEAGDLYYKLIPEVDLIVTDSIVSMIPEEEIDRQTNEPTMGLQARVNSVITRKIYQAIGKRNTIMIFINQLREKIGGYGNPYTTGGGHCFDEETRILTKQGLKNYQELKIGDLIPTVNLQNQIIEYKPVKNIIVEKIDGKLYQFNNKYNDKFLFTTNHQLLLKKFVNKGLLNEKKYGDIFANEERARYPFPVAFPSGNKEYPISDDELKFLAWILTDGSITHTDCWKIHIYQSKPQYVKEIKKLFKNLNIKFSEYSRKRKKNWLRSYTFSVLNSKNIVDKYNLSTDRLLPEWMFDLSDRQAKIFMEELIKGDGNKVRNLNKYICDGSFDKIIQYARLCVTHNIPISKIKKDSRNKNCYYLLFKLSDYLGYVKNQKKEVNYKGIVWDIEVDNYYHFIERNGRIIATHNSLKHMYNTRIEFKAGQPIDQGTGENKERIGVEINLKAVKNKKGVPYKSAVCDFYYNGLIDNKKSIFWTALKYNIINLSGKTYTYDKLKVVGKDNMIAELKDEQWKEIESKVWEVMK